MLEFKNNNNNECMKRDLKRYENEKKIMVLNIDPLSSMVILSSPSICQTGT